MKKYRHGFSWGFAVFSLIILLVASGSAQRRGNAYSKQYIEQLLERIEERNDAFTDSFDDALDNSRLDTTRTEENFTDRSRDLENATDELRREFDHNDSRGETAANVRKVLTIASDINRIMLRRNLGRQTEATWVQLRAELNTLAKIYNTPVVGSRTYGNAVVRNAAVAPRVVRSSNRVVSKQLVEQLLERIEERSDAFTKTFDDALDNSNLDTTRAEENFTDRSRDLENATDELRREFDHNDSRGETSENVRKVMMAATVVNRIVNSRNFGRPSEYAWTQMRAELNALAKIYGLPSVGARTYR